MPEVGGEQRQLAVDVLAGGVGVDQRVHAEAVAQVVRARSLAVAAALEADLTDQLHEGPVELLARHPLAPGADEERRCGGLWEPSVARPGVVAQRRGRRGVQRHLALLVVLGGPHVQRPVPQVDVVAVERERLPGPQAG